MASVTVGVRELKARLSEYLQRLKAGQTIVITDRGEMVGRIVPGGQSLDQKLRELMRAGMVSWSGRKLMPLRPAARSRGKSSVADLLVSDRE